ncbi:hypothetical protein GGP41_006651 [Bipolaris sorokiniana]|uniref:FAD-binding domain-containing protein n=1 Tax=Cochliobolus sativus TaxID=45130 RepID=A0A8H5ZT55_COCSA|nr:hypothetical protein GGP41_006651 [Bipolaris sorokiniana]
MQHKPPTGISVLIVGSGLGGLTFAIEAYRQGHDVQIIEKRPKIEDFVTPSEIHVFQHNGKSLGNFPLGTPELTSLAVNRLGMHLEFVQYAEDLGIKTQYSTHATEYTETDDAGIVILSDGRKLTTDMVVAADGVGSGSWKLILDKFEKPVSSGYAIYRADFPTGDAMKNPIIVEHYNGAKTRMELYFGPNAHGVITKMQDRIS